MGVHADTSAPTPSISSPGGATSETETSVTSSSPSLPVSSSSSSFAHRDFSSLASTSPDSLTRQDIKHHQKTHDLLAEGHVLDDDSRNVKECTCREPGQGSKRALMGSCRRCKMGVSMRRACCRCAGGFAADCAALCCCPCAIVSLLAFIVVELPYSLAKKMITHRKKGLSVKDSADSNPDYSLSISTPSRSRREPSKGGEVHAVQMIRFDTENLLKHFDAEHVGFGCLSQKRE